MTAAEPDEAVRLAVLRGRTYVRGPDDRAGLWFFSLDADNALFVLGACAVVGA